MKRLKVKINALVSTEKKNCLFITQKKKISTPFLFGEKKSPPEINIDNTSARYI